MCPLNLSIDYPNYADVFKNLSIDYGVNYRLYTVQKSLNDYKDLQNTGSARYRKNEPFPLF